MWLPRRGACRELPVSRAPRGTCNFTSQMWADVGRLQEGLQGGDGEAGRDLDPIGEDSYRDQLTLVEDLFRDWK